MIPFSKEYIEEQIKQSFIRFDIQRFATLLRTWSTYYRISGTGTPSSYVFDTYGQITVYLESQDLAANTSQIRIDHKTAIWRHSDASTSHYAVVNNVSSYRANNGSPGGSYQSKSHNITRYGAAVTDTYTVGAGSTYHTVYHNSDGTCQLYINGSATLAITIYYPGGNNVFGSLAKNSSFNMAIATIPRYANIASFTASNPSGVDGLSKINVAWVADVACSAITYSLDGGATWSGSVGNGMSGNFTITGRDPGIMYNIMLSPQRSDSGLWNPGSGGSKQVTTTQNALITTPIDAAEMNVENNIIINFSNPSGAPVNLRVETLNPITTRVTRNGITSPYTLTLTTEEKNTIYQSNINTNKIPIRFVVDTIGTSTYYDWNDYKAYITDTPEMGMFTVEANDTKTQDLMNWLDSVEEDNGKIIQSKTLLKLVFGELILKKFATLKKYNITAGGQPYETTNSYIVLTSGLTVNGSIIVEAIDTRDNKFSMSFPYTLIPYEVPSISNVVADRNDYPGDNIIHLSFQGKIAKLIYDTSEYLIKYRYKARESGASWSSLITIAPDIDSNGTILYDEDLAVSFDTEKGYDIEPQISDYFTDIPITGADFVTNTIPLLEITEEGISIMGSYDINIGGPLQIEGKLPITSSTIEEWPD